MAVGSNPTTGAIEDFIRTRHMSLQKDMSIFQIKRFLNEEVKQQVLFDITPILNLGQTAGGYFGVTRQILCMIDFFGALYHGYSGEIENGRKTIQHTRYTIDFLMEFIGTKIDPMYATNGGYLITMYRHGLVHLYQPKVLKMDDGKFLSWFVYKGPRENATVEVGSRKFPNVKHLCIYNDPDNSNTRHLPISIDSLYYDLLTTIDLYVKEIEEDTTRLSNFVSTANAIVDPEGYA